VLLGSAWLIYSLVFDRGAQPDAPTPVPPEPPAIADAGIPAPDAGQEPEADAPRQVTVIEVSGRVEHRLPDQPWHAVAQGDRLGLNETIKTGPTAKAKLRVDEHSLLEVTAQAELGIQELSDTVHRFNLKHGRVRAEYAEDGERVLRIEALDVGAVAEAKAGRFSVLSTDRVVSVATVEGQVKLTARAETVTISAGQKTAVAKGEKPAPPKPISRKILLRIAAPSKRVQRAGHVFIRGRTDPGAQVTINQTEAPVDEKGRFKVRVPLQEGPNRLTAVSQDVSGERTTRDLGVVVVDPTAPVEQMQIKWDKDG
jgi:hypothetical protein